MTYAIVNNGIVENVVVWDGETPYTPPEGSIIVQSDVAGIGWSYNYETGEFTPPASAQLLFVPVSITRRQCALQLLALQYITSEEALAMTKSAEVPAAVAAVFDQAVANGTMTAEQRVLAEIDFAAANYYRSNSLLGLMGLTEAEIDQFFIAAAQL